jgi:signal transduction histidine kinase
MGVQAGAARSVFDAEPQKAREALSAIEHASRNAVQELDRLLGFLRQEDDVDRLAPQPSLHRLEDLTSEIAAAGLLVDLRIEGDVRPVPPTVEVSAYRMIQEALTNTVKHADASRVSVTIRYLPTDVEVEVLDDGRARDTGRRAGHGLIGMRERAKLLNGRLQVGPAPDGGFSVRATIPVDGGDR